MVTELSLNFGVFKTGHNCGTGALTASDRGCQLYSGNGKIEIELGSTSGGVFTMKWS